MGAWGPNAFQNDAACDWAYALETAVDLTPVVEVLEAVLATPDYLDAELASEGLAACEVLARLQGRWGVRDAYTEAVDIWVIAHRLAPPLELVKHALAVVDRVLGPDSELRELWDEAGESQWIEAVADLRARLAG
jgi:hypothetical protein